MGGSVRIEAEAFADERYDDLATFAGLADADHARGKMAKLWRQCTLEGTYKLENHLVLRVLGSNGIDALIRARLGERAGDSHVRIKGTKGRIEWLEHLRENGRRGGRPRKSQAVKSKPDGKPSGFRSQKPDVNHLGVEELNPPAPAPAPSLDQRDTARKEPSLSGGPKASDHKTAIAHFDARFLDAYGSKPSWGAKQGEQIRRLLSRHGLETFKQRTDAMFEHPPPWLKPPFDLGTLEANFDKFVNGHAVVRKRVVTGGELDLEDPS